MALKQPRSTSHTPLWLVAAYIRLSREDGNDESMSVTNQKKIIGEYLETSFQGEFTLVGYYIDDGATGTDYERPGFQRMIHDMETGNVNCIICKNLSRMFRNYSDQGYFLEKVFPVHGTRFIAVGDPQVDSYLHPEAIEGLEVPINGLMNDRFAAKTSHDVRNTFATKRRKGEFIGAFAPYGYQKAPDNKNALVIDREAAEVVQKIYQWFVYEGMSKSRIAHRLNEAGILSPAVYKRKKGLLFYCPQMGNHDGLWSPASVSAVLKNRMYTGTMVQGKQTVVSYKVHDRIAVPEEKWCLVPGTHEPIIEEELFAKAADLQTKTARTAPAEKRLHLLAGMLRCADCKKVMTRQKMGELVYYYCRTHREKSPHACTKHAVKEDMILKMILASIQIHVFLSAFPKEGRGGGELTAVSDETARIVGIIGRREKELDRNRELSDGLYDDWKNGDISKEEYIRLKARYSMRESRLRSAIETLHAEREAAVRDTEENSSFLADFLENKMIRVLNRGLLVSLVKNVFIYEDGRIMIEFDFADPYRRFTEKGR